MVSPLVSVCSHFVSGADHKNPWGDFFQFAHAHPLGSVYVPFGVYEICPT